MEVIIANSVGMIMGFIVVGLENPRERVYRALNVSLYFSLIIWTMFYFVSFYLLKGFSEYTPFFVDEITYIYDFSYLSSFSSFVRLIINNFGLAAFFILSSFMMTWALLRVFYQLMLRGFITQFLLILMFGAVSYWSLFVLKETLSVAGAVLVFFPGKRRKSLSFLLGLCVLVVVRLELAIFCIAAYVLYLIRKRSRVSFLFAIFLTFVIVLFFLSTEAGMNFRLGILARSGGASNKSFNGEVYYFSKSSLMEFFSSGLYWRTLLTNAIETFLPVLDLVLPLKLINIMGLFCLIVRRRVTPSSLYYLMVVLSSVFTHSNIRYVLTASIVIILDAFLEQEV